jgi:protoheme IX farnesyltransferase
MLMCIASLFLLFAKINPLSALFTLATILSYLCWYTPAKRWSRWSTEIGALAGAFPPLIGWAAGEGRITALGWILFGILFFWQIPHFMAVAWIYRKDYTVVNFPMLAVRDESGVWVSRWSLACTAALVVVSLLPMVYHLTGWLYGAAAILTGIFFLWRAMQFLRTEGRDQAARKLFLASISYLPVLLIVLVVDRLLFVS